MSRGARKHSLPSGPTASMRKPFVIDQTRRPRRVSTADPARRARSASPWCAAQLDDHALAHRDHAGLFKDAVDVDRAFLASAHKAEGAARRMRPGTEAQ